MHDVRECGDKAARRGGRWMRQAALLTSVALGAALLAGCPPRPGPPTPIAAAQPVEAGPAPVVGMPPPTAGVTMPLSVKLPLTGEALAKAMLPRDKIEAEALAPATGTAPATAAATATATATATAPATTVAASATAPAEHEPAPMAIKYYLLGREKFNDRTYGEAIEYFDKALRVDPQMFAAMRSMGEACFQSNQLSRGSLYLQRAVALRPQDVMVNYLLGRYWMQHRDWRQALRYLLTADASPERATNLGITPLVSLHLAQVLQAAGYYLAAAREYEDFLTLVAQPIPSFRYDRELNYYIEEQWAVELAAAENLYAVGRYAQAVPHFEAALEHNEQDRYINARLAAAQAYAGDYRPAIRRATQVVLSTQGSDEGLALLTWTYRKAGMAGRMIADLQAMAAADGSDAGAVLALAMLQEKAGQTEQALGALAGYLRAKPDDFVLLKRAVELARQRQALPVGFAALVQALRAQPEKAGEVRSLLAQLVGEKPAAQTLELLETAATLQARRPTDPAEGYRQYLLAVVARAAEQKQKAAAHYDAALKALPTYFPAREAYVGMMLTEENFPKVRQLVDEALALNSGGLKARQLQIEAEIAQQRYASALKLAQKAKDDFPDSPELRLLLGTVYRLRDQDREAAAEFAAVVDRFPKYEPGYRAALEMTTHMKEPQQTEQILGKLLTELPNSRFAQTRMALYLFQRRRVADAEAILRRLINDDPNDAEAVTNLATVEALAGKRDAAIKLLQEALARQGKDTPSVALVQTLAEIYKADQRGDEALTLVQKYYKEHPDSEPWLMLYASELLARRQKNEAEELLRAGLQKHPASQVLATTLARFLASNERAGEGVAAMEKFIDANGTSIERLYLLAHLYEEAGDPDKATATLQRVLEMMPEHTGANNDLGFFWADRGIHLAQAENMINKALDNQPNNAAFLDSLGWVYYKQGRFGNAVAMLRRAIAAAEGQDEPELMSHLGDALYRSGKKDEAAEYWRSAYAMLTDPDAKEASPEKARLKKYLAGVLQEVREGKAPSVSPLAREPEERKPPPETLDSPRVSNP